MARANQKWLALFLSASLSWGPSQRSFKLKNRLTATDYNLKHAGLTSSQDWGSQNKKDGFCTCNPSPKSTQSFPPSNARASAHVRVENTNIIALFATRNRTCSFLVCGKYGKFFHTHTGTHMKRKKKDTILDFLWISESKTTAKAAILKPN